MGEPPSPASASRASLEDVVSTIVLDAAAVEVTSALGKSGIPSRLLKGAAIASWLYDGLDRAYVDVDLLVPPRERRPAEDVLRELGFASAEGNAPRVDRPRHARVWERGAVLVDLHTTLAGIGVAPQQAWELLAPEVEPVGVSGREIEALSVPARALHVVLHAAQHGDRSPLALADLERALERVPIETWRESEALARRLDALPAFAAGLSLVPEGSALAARLGLAGASSVEAELRTGVRREETLGSALGFEWLAGRRLREQASFVAAKLAPPPAAMRRRSALARRGRVGLTIAYPLRLVRLAPHAAAGFVAWRRARRRAS